MQVQQIIELTKMSTQFSAHAMSEINTICQVNRRGIWKECNIFSVTDYQNHSCAGGLPQPLAQPFAQMCYRCKYQVSSTGPNRLEVCLYNNFLSVSTCEFVTTKLISLRIFKISLELLLLAHTLFFRAAKALVKF